LAAQAAEKNDVGSIKCLPNQVNDCEHCENAEHGQRDKQAPEDAANHGFGFYIQSAAWAATSAGR
jgi:hypothetical protein